jgi:hypothetical protein
MRLLPKFYLDQKQAEDTRLYGLDPINSRQDIAVLCAIIDNLIIDLQKTKRFFTQPPLNKN